MIIIIIKMKNKTNKKQMPDLTGFTGTTQYHKLTMGDLKFTDGWAYLAQEIGCFWLADIVGSVQHLPKIKEYKQFILWKIELKDKQAIVSAYWDTEEDGSFSDDKKLYTQTIEYTDFPETNFEWYQEGDVVLLKNEH